MIKKLFTQESKTITGAALIIGLSAIASRFLGLIRDRLLVGRFGVGDELDAYYASFQVPNFIFALLVLGTLSVAFIPVFTEYVAKGRKDEAWHMTNSILSIVYVFMGGICLALSFGAPWLVKIIAPGFGGDKLDLTVRLTRVMMLSPFFFSISAVFSSVLNSYKHFLTVSLAPLLYNAAIIFGVAVLSKPFGILGVSYGAIIGALLHLSIQLPAVLALGWKSRFIIDTRQAGVREVGKLFLPRVFGIDISQISQFIGTSIGTTLGTGASALFNLAMNISAVPVGAIAIPFGIAAFPNLSEAIAKNDRQGFVRVFASTFRQILFLLVPLSTLGFILRVPIVRIVLGAKTLNLDETLLTAAAFGMFAVSLVFQSLAPLLARAFYALKNTVVPVIVSFVSVAIYVIAAQLFISTAGPSFKSMMGLGGIRLEVKVLALPIAFSIASVIQVGMLVVILRKKFGRIGGANILRAFAVFGFGAAAAAVAAFAAEWLVGPALNLATFIGVFLQAVAASVAGFAAYGFVLWLAKSEELTNFIGSLKRKMLRVEKPVAMNETQGM